MHTRTSHLSPTLQGLLWMVASGVFFTFLNALSRALAQAFDPLQTQFLRYFFGFVVLMPWIIRHGWGRYRTSGLGHHVFRAGLHTVALSMWFTALPQIPLADTTALGFTGPLFIMLGAYWFLREPMRWERWAATLMGFVGVLVVVGPKISWGDPSAGGYHLLMLASAPVFAASFLMTKIQSRNEDPATLLIWQNLMITLLSLPLALMHWKAPGALHWALFLGCGILGSLGHYCQNRAISAADVSATQSPKFLELVWAAMLGWIAFGDTPSQSTLIGGALISAATLWVARRERHDPKGRS